MQTTTSNPELEDRTARVRETLKGYLRENTHFLSLPHSEQLGLYRDMLQRGLEADAQTNGFAYGLADRKRRRRRDDKLPDPTTLQDVAGLAGGFLEEVSFPNFVRDLITGTYGSIVESTIQQMNAYTKMYKELAKPLGAIVKDITDADALGQVATDNPLRFTMGSDGDLTDNDSGMKLDTSDDEVQRLMFQAKLKLAKERRLLLRETMLMGVSRLVVEKGTIKAGLIFNVTAKEAFRGKEKETDITQTGGQSGGSFFGLFGGGSSERTTNISVSSRQLATDTELAAKITGHVEVNFKSDYFKLDNFADLFGDESTRAVIAERQGQQPQAGAPAGRAAIPAPAPVPAPAPAMR